MSLTGIVLLCLWRFSSSAKVIKRSLDWWGENELTLSPEKFQILISEILSCCYEASTTILLNGQFQVSRSGTARYSYSDHVKDIILTGVYTLNFN